MCEFILLQNSKGSLVMYLLLMTSFWFAAHRWHQDSVVSAHGQIIKLCSFKCRSKFSIWIPYEILIWSFIDHCFSFFVQVLPEFLHVEAFAKLSSAIGKVTNHFLIVLSEHDRMHTTLTTEFYEQWNREPTIKKLLDWRKKITKIG